MEFKKLGIATLVATGISLASTANAQVINLDIDSSAEELVSSTFSFLPQRVRDVTSFSSKEKELLNRVWQKAYEDVTSIQEGLFPDTIRLVKTLAQ